jgi:hypothetical protein
MVSEIDHLILGGDERKMKGVSHPLRSCASCLLKVKHLLATMEVSRERQLRPAAQGI